MSVSIGDRLRVHYNLHRKDYSLTDPKTRRVIGNVPTITLLDVEFRVSKAGRQRVIQSNQRSVHAYAIGYVQSLDACDITGMTPLTYNPYRAPFFHEQGEPSRSVTQADRVTFVGAYCYAAWSSPHRTQCCSPVRRDRSKQRRKS